MIRRIKRFVRDRRGVAAVEFALWSVLILGALVPCLDFANYLLQSDRLNGAVGQASILAYNMRGGAVDTQQLSQYVAASAGSGLAVSATVSCNGNQQSCATPPSDRACACVGPGKPVTFVPTGVCGATCAGGATSGFYLTVAGTRPYRTIVPNRWLNGQIIEGTTTVRLQ